MLGSVRLKYLPFYLAETFTPKLALSMAFPHWRDKLCAGFREGYKRGKASPADDPFFEKVVNVISNTVAFKTLTILPTTSISQLTN